MYNLTQNVQNNKYFNTQLCLCCGLSQSENALWDVYLGTYLTGFPFVKDSRKNKQSAFIDYYLTTPISLNLSAYFVSITNALQIHNRDMYIPGALAAEYVPLPMIIQIRKHFIIHVTICWMSAQLVHNIYYIH